MALMHIIFLDQGYVLLALLPLCLWIYRYSKQPSKHVSRLPLVRERPGKRFFSLRTRWAYYTDCANLYRDAYHNVRRLLEEFDAKTANKLISSRRKICQSGSRHLEHETRLSYPKAA